MPIPPYLRRDTVPEDRSTYQTVYARENCIGSVAAPTAGLHFSDDVLSKLRLMGVTRSDISLHVSAGTFKPVSVQVGVGIGIGTG